MAMLDQDLAHFKTLAATKTPRIMKAVTWMLLIGTVLTIGFLVFVPWVQTTSGSGSESRPDFGPCGWEGERDDKSIKMGFPTRGMKNKERRCVRGSKERENWLPRGSF